MYTEREKVRYVEMMWAEGLTPCAASRKWGCPSRRMLSKWTKEAEAGELPAERPRVLGRTERIGRSLYPEETKAEAVRLHKLGEKRMHIARRLGIVDPSIISVWVKKDRDRAMMSGTDADGASRKDSGKAGRKMPKARGGNGGEAAELRAELEEARLELAAYKELMRDPKAGNLASLSKRQLVGLGERLRKGCGFSLARTLTFLGLSKSTYFYWLGRTSSREKTDLELDEAVAAAFAKNKGIYGYRRIRAALELEGVRAPEHKVRDSMTRQGLVARCSRSEKKWSSYAGEISDAPANLLLGDRGRHTFSADGPGKLWLTDITEMKGRDGKCYLSVIVDCFDGKVVARRSSTNPDAKLANGTLLDAVATLKPGQRPIIHSDRGGHYRWKEWIAICEQAGLVRSMSRKGRSPDNAACEGFFGRMKVEAFHALVRAGATIAELTDEIESYVSWYNEGRLKAFHTHERKVSYDTIEGRRRRLGLAS